MSRFAMLDQVDHTGANPRKILVNLEAIIRVFPMSERHCFVVTGSYNEDAVDAASRDAGLQSSGLYVSGSLHDLATAMHTSSWTL